MAKMTPRTLSGFMELLPAPQMQMERMMETLRRSYSLYGFTPLDTPVIEAAKEYRYGKFLRLGMHRKFSQTHQDLTDFHRF